MDELIAIVKKFEVLLSSVVAIIPLTFVFRRQLLELGDQLDSIFNPVKHKWKRDFAQQVRKWKSDFAPEVQKQKKAVDGAKQRGRDMMLEAWGAVKQAVYDGCIANGIVPASRVPKALTDLGAVRALGTDLVSLVKFLDDWGLQVASDNGRRPQDHDALAYRDLADIAVARLGQSALVPVKQPPPLQAPPAPPPRRTVVGGNFAPPSPGSAGAALVAVAGPMKGQQYPVDKSTYRLGRNANNDLCAAADDAVSGDHACLRYQNGGLFLYDQGSLNGTFLNEQRVTGAPVMVQYGDRIRLGESVFEVVGTSASPKSGGAKDEPRQGRPGTEVR